MAKILHEEGRGVPDRLLVEGMQHGVAGAVRRGAGALRGALAEVRGHAAEGALVDASLLGARERHAVVLQFDDGRGRLLAHQLDGVLVAEPVGTLDRVIHVPAPVIGPHVAQRGADAALRGDRVAARRKQLADAGRGQAGLGQTERRAQPGAAGPDDDHIVGVVDEFIGTQSGLPKAMRSTANTPSAARRT